MLIMREEERAVEWLRPFVDTKDWDYCVVWKLGDDPSRFIEWAGCCCSGGNGHANVKEENVVQQNLGPICRDVHLKHPIRTKACEALAKFPSFMPLYSGIHGEVVTTNQPRWVNQANAQDSNTSQESIGTRVFIPVFGGLIELFAAMPIPKDQNIIDSVIARCNVSIEQEFMKAGSYANLGLNECVDPFLEENFHNCPTPFHLLSFIPRIQCLPLVAQSSTLSYEGSSSFSNPSNECPSFDSSYGYVDQNEPPKQSNRRSSGCKKYKYDDNFKEQTRFVLASDGKVVKDVKEVNQRPGREHYKSKNLVTERNRRNRIRDGIFALRALVPKITKMDRIATLGDAADYIMELQQEEKKLRDELNEIEEQDCKEDNVEMKSSELDGLHEGSRYLPPIVQNKNSLGCGEKGKAEVHVEVTQINKKVFLIKLICDKKRGGFERLMKVISSLELQVVNANITTYNGKVLNVLEVEACRKDIQPKKLRETLIELTG